MTEDKYKTIKELINQWIERERENLQEARTHGGTNTPGYNQALGALEACRQVLSDIEALEQEAVHS